VTPDNKGQIIAFVVITAFFIGWNEVLVITLATFAIADQRDIGAAVGFAGSARAVISAVGSVIYSVVLTSRLEDTIPAELVPALVGAGLPATSIPDFVTALSTGASFDGVQGVTSEIVAAGVRAFKLGYADGFSTIFLVSIAFSTLATIACFFVPNVESQMTNEVAVLIHQRDHTHVPGEGNEKNGVVLEK
jgi:hypothetical protein